MVGEEGKVEEDEEDVGKDGEEEEELISNNQ